MTKKSKTTPYMVEHSWHITKKDNANVTNIGTLYSYISTYVERDELQLIHDKFMKKLRKIGFDKSAYDTQLITKLYVQKVYTWLYNSHPQTSKLFYWDSSRNEEVTGVEHMYRVTALHGAEGQQSLYEVIVYADSIENVSLPKYHAGSIVSICLLHDMEVK
jgi:hypothetical protein